MKIKNYDNVFMIELWIEKLMILFSWKKPIHKYKPVLAFIYDPA